MAKRYVVLPLATVTGTNFEDLTDATTAAGKKVGADGRPHVIVSIVGEVRPRIGPNVDVVMLDESEVAHVG